MAAHTYSSTIHDCYHIEHTYSYIHGCQKYQGSVKSSILRLCYALLRLGIGLSAKALSSFCSVKTLPALRLGTALLCVETNNSHMNRQANGRSICQW